MCGLINGAAYLQAKGIDALLAGAMLRDAPADDARGAASIFPRPESRPGHATSADPVLDRNPFD
ncbi:MAG TPA: type II secretion system protein GspC, partial [Minicystis sp.]|nr:type II secretion system protein GspC [Minicystis sp.]